MFRNYLITSLRYLRNHKTYAVINIVGLAAGLSVCFFAWLYVNFELTYDDFNRNADRIYRVVTDVQTPQGTVYESSWGPLAAAIRENCPEVEKATHFFLDYLLIQKDLDNFREEKIAYADSTLFSVFTLPLVRGKANEILNAPGSLVLSESAAHRYFGDADPIGQVLHINGKQTAHVTGVMKDIPYNSHFRVDLLVSKATLGESWMRNWKRFYFYTYVLLRENNNPALLESKLPSIVASHLEQTDIKYNLSVEPLKRIYLEGKPRGSRAGTIVTGNKGNVYIFSVVAIFILIIAGFNFINLATAFSLQRAREIGVRKVVGGSRKQLIVQFLMDALLISLTAFIISLGFCSLLLPLFNEVAGKIIADGLFQHPIFILELLGVSVAIGLISGIYPAFFLSGFVPLRVLKGKYMTSSTGLSLRKTLVTVQFVISSVLIAATIIIYSQITFMQNHELGFKKDHQVVVDFQYDERINGREEDVRRRLLEVPHVSQVSMSSSIPGKANHKYPVRIEDKSMSIREFQSDTYFIDYDFFKQYEIELVAGRAFSSMIASDSAEAMIVNETAARSLGFVNPRDAIGKPFEQLRWKGVIIGVVRDFHFRSFQEEVRPLTFLISKSFLTLLTVTVSSSDLSLTLTGLENKWHQMVPGMPFAYFFADENYHAQYIEEERFGKLFICFAVLAIGISCLGLAGLSTFSISQRTKEIGIRKVLGSSVGQIVALLGRELMVIMLAAFVIAVPLAGYGMDRWLSGFAYHVTITWWMYSISGLIAGIVAFISVGFQTMRAATRNPVESLRILD